MGGRNLEHSSPPDLSWESKLVEEEVAVRADGRGVMGQSVSAVCKRGLVSWRLPSDKPTELWRVSTPGSSASHWQLCLRSKKQSALDGETCPSSTLPCSTVPPAFLGTKSKTVPAGKGEIFVGSKLQYHQTG